MNCPKTLNDFNTILTVNELNARWKSIAELDPGFSARAKEFWESRTPAQLEAFAHQAWLTCDNEQYVVARSYLAAHDSTPDAECVAAVARDLDKLRERLEEAREADG